MENTRDMTKGSPAKLLFFFAIPLMLGNLFQQFYTMVDTIIVGQGVGVGALASLGAADWLNWLFQGLATGLTQGFSILFAQFYGAGNRTALKKSIGNAVILTCAAAVCLTAAAQGSLTWVLDILKTPSDIYGGSLIYLRIMFAGIPIVLFYNLEAALLRALGDGRSPLMAMIIASVTNIVLDLLFVMGFKWGIPGAAAATLIAQGVSMVYCFFVVRRITILKLQKEDFKMEGQLSKELLGLGIPVMFQNTVISVGGMVVQSVINGFGFLFVAGFTATNKLYGLLETAATSFGFSITTYTAQNMGAGRYDRIKRGTRSGVVMALATSLIVSAVMLLFGKGILSLFISKEAGGAEEVLAIAYHYLAIMSIFLTILYALHAYRCALQGLGDTVTPMVSGIVEFAMRVLAALLLPKLVGQEGIYYAEILAWIGAAVLLAWAYYRRMGRLEK